MTIHERRKWREQVLAEELARAHRRAGFKRLTPSCIVAMELTGSKPAEARELHRSCKEEEPGGKGCACLCHDVITGEVSAGDLIPVE